MVQMPAVNTPQFSWVLSRLPRHAQPVPPIYQPEVAARAVLYAADHPRRREYWVGAQHARHAGRQRGRPGPARPLPGPDRLRLAADRPAAATRTQPANLWEPADGPTAATSARTASSTTSRTPRSSQLWASQHHGLLGALAGGAAAGTVAVVRAARR